MLRFNSEENRMQHPQARLIPREQWELWFGSQLTQVQLSLIQITEQELEGELQQKVNIVSLNEHERKTWLVWIIASHPSLNAENIIHLAEVLRMNLTDVFHVASILGNLTVTEKVITLARERRIRIKDMVSESDYAAFSSAAKGGHLAVLNKLLELTSEKNGINIKDMVSAGGDYNAFIYAAENGHLAVLDKLIELASANGISIKDMVSAGKYRAFSNAARNGHLAVMNKLLELASANGIRIKNMVSGSNRNAFCFAAKGGHLAVLNKLLELASENGINIKDMLLLGFESAAEGGHLVVINKLLEVAPANGISIKDMVFSAINHAAFSLAAKGGHIAVLDKLLEVAPANGISIKDMVSASRYAAFSFAALNGHIAVLDKLLELAPANGISIKDMVSAGSYAAFRFAAVKGDIAVLDKLLELASENGINIKDMLLLGFEPAAKGGHLAVLDKLIELAPANDISMKDMLSAWDINALNLIAENGDLAVLDKLIELTHENDINIKGMVLATDYRAFRYAAKNGHLAVLDKLLEFARENGISIKDMASAGDYYAFRYAAVAGYSAVVDKLLELARENGISIKDMVSAGNYYAFHYSAKSGNLAVPNMLLTLPTCFAYAESHDYEYGHYIHPFMVNQLTSLRNESAAQRNANPNSVFEITDLERAQLCFYMIRNIIRRNDRALDDDLRFLLTIPAVKELAHTAVTPNEPNELVRFALTTGNTLAAELLLNISAVRTLAEQHDYYRGEAQGGIDLGMLAQDRESSMQVLTTGEQKRLEAAIKFYQPVLNKIGVGKVMEQLREQLIKRYLAKPARILVGGKECVLPVTWKEFNALNLKGADRKNALEAYFQHKEHTFLRYLSKPNHWMSENASYVNEDEVTHERWSTFEEYQSIIALLNLAAKDANQPAIDGHTLEGRIDHFIDEGAHIGRAHNWDKLRIKVNANGEPELDKTGEPIEEEYDDLEGDKPSCFSGVNRRLFQSVVGHPLITIFTHDLLKQELSSYVYNYFSRVVDATNREQLKSIMDTLANEIDIDYTAVVAPLKKLDMTTKQEKEFIKYLTKKYGDQFSAEPRFKEYIAETLSLSHGFIEESANSHFSKLYDFANLKSLLSKPADVVKASTDDSANKQDNEKIKLLLVKARGVAPYSDDAYDYIRRGLLAYSRADTGNEFFASVARIATGHWANYGSIVAKLLLKKEYKHFDKEKLAAFFGELRDAIKDLDKINRNGDLHAILTVAERFTGVAFYPVELKEQQSRFDASSKQ